MDMLSSNSVLSFTGIWFTEPFNLFSFKLTNSNCTFMHTYIHRCPSECILIIIVIKNLHRFFSSWLSLILPYRYNKVFSLHSFPHISSPDTEQSPSHHSHSLSKIHGFWFGFVIPLLQRGPFANVGLELSIETSKVTSGYTAESNASTFARICN